LVTLKHNCLAAINSKALPTKLQKNDLLLHTLRTIGNRIPIFQNMQNQPIAKASIKANDDRKIESTWRKHNAKTICIN
jgi:hypothetical protein